MSRPVLLDSDKISKAVVIKGRARRDYRAARVVQSVVCDLRRSTQPVNDADIIDFVQLKRHRLATLFPNGCSNVLNWLASPE